MALLILGILGLVLAGTVAAFLAIRVMLWIAVGLVVVTVRLLVGLGRWASR